jgi:hypothetical protein
MNYSKAEVATVDFGFIQVEGLMLPSGEYAIGVRQANEFLSFAGSHRNANRALKALLGEGYAGLRVATELNSNKAYILTIDQFKRVVRELDKRGNPVASAFIDASLEEAIERRFDRAFNVKRSEDERNALMELRVKRLLARRKWTDVIQQRNLELFGMVPTPEQFRDWTVKANLALFNCRHFKCDRDNMTITEQMIIESFEFLCCRWAKKYPQETPDQILDRVLATF